MTDPASAPTSTEPLAQRLAAATQDREVVEQRLRDAMRATFAELAPALRSAIAAQVAAQDALLDAVTAEGPSAYPEGARTRTAHGISYGYRRGKPSIDVPDHGRSIAAARTLYSAADVAAIVDTVETLRVSAVAKWTDEQLASIHVRRVDGEDAPFVRVAGGDAEKLAKAVADQTIRQLSKEAA